MNILKYVIVVIGLLDVSKNLRKINNVNAEQLEIIDAFNYNFNDNELVSELFDEYISKFGVNIPSDEYGMRMNIFEKNLLDIIDFNKNSQDDSFNKDINHFAHLTSEEFKNLVSSKKHFNTFSGRKFKNTHSCEFPRECSKEMPKEVDWVSKGAVTKVKNQGQCGSCWAFSATGAVESAHYLKTGNLVELSEQMLVSCDHKSMACNGGLMDQAFTWMENHQGLCSEEDYPYVSGDGFVRLCKKCDRVPETKMSYYVDVVPESVEEMKKAVLKQPVAIAIEADEKIFQFYSSGVITADCGQKLDHGVLLVGYGTTDDGIDYWKVKNSWGQGWGDNGYIKIKMSDENLCGILSSGSYPVI